MDRTKTAAERSARALPCRWIRCTICCRPTQAEANCLVWNPQLNPSNIIVTRRRLDGAAAVEKNLRPDDGAGQQLAVLDEETELAGI